MYLLNTQTQIEWVLDKTPNVILLSDLYTRTIDPDGNIVFAQAQSLVAPTATEQGLVTHNITPDAEGVWSITLVKGTPTSYTELDKVVMSVRNNDTIVQPVGVQ